jgi:hypothetical protein
MVEAAVIALPFSAMALALAEVEATRARPVMLKLEFPDTVRSLGAAVFRS